MIRTQIALGQLAHQERIFQVDNDRFCRRVCAFVHQAGVWPINQDSANFGSGIAEKFSNAVSADLHAC